MFGTRFDMTLSHEEAHALWGHVGGLFQLDRDVDSQTFRRPFVLIRGYNDAPGYDARQKEHRCEPPLACYC